MPFQVTQVSEQRVEALRDVPLVPQLWFPRGGPMVCLLSPSPRRLLPLTPFPGSYTVRASPPYNRVVRYTANGDVAEVGSDVAIARLGNLAAGNHNGGAIHFGPDGKLYWSAGENAVATNAQDLTNTFGKIHRFNEDGTIPSGCWSLHAVCVYVCV